MIRELEYSFDSSLRELTSVVKFNSDIDDAPDDTLNCQSRVDLPWKRVGKELRASTGRHGQVRRWAVKRAA